MFNLKKQNKKPLIYHKQQSLILFLGYLVFNNTEHLKCGNGKYKCLKWAVTVFSLTETSVGIRFISSN